MGQRVAHDFRLLVDFLGHEVTVIALFGQQASGGTALDAALDDLAGGVVHLGARASHHRPVALVEIGDPVGEGRQRQRVRAEIHRAVAIADGQRRSPPRPDQEIVMRLEQIDEREGAAHALQGGEHGLGGLLAGREFVLDHEGGDLGVGFAGEGIALGRQLLAQRLEVFDDAVVDHGEPARGVRMGVRLGRLAVRRPAGVANADRAPERFRGEPRLEVLELALGATPGEPAILQRRHACQVVAPVFEPFEGVDDRTRNRAFAEHAHNAAHRLAFP